MARYLDEAAAAADGIVIVHEPEMQRFALYREGDVERALIGEAHYALPDDATIDFDHTFVRPEFRGTGLSELLAHRATRSELAASRTVRASCWFIEEYLAKHPIAQH